MCFMPQFLGLTKPQTYFMFKILRIFLEFKRKRGYVSAFGYSALIISFETSHRDMFLALLKYCNPSTDRS